MKWLKRERKKKPGTEQSKEKQKRQARGKTESAAGQVRVGGREASPSRNQSKKSGSVNIYKTTSPLQVIKFKPQRYIYIYIESPLLYLCFNSLSSPPLIFFSCLPTKSIFQPSLYFFLSSSPYILRIQVCLQHILVSIHGRGLDFLGFLYHPSSAMQLIVHFLLQFSLSTMSQFCIP